MHSKKVDLFDKKHKIKLSKKCCIEKHEKEKFNFKHFLKIHIKLNIRDKNKIKLDSE